MIGSWVTPPTTGVIEIERGGDENITINHGCRQGEAGRQAATVMAMAMAMAGAGAGAAAATAVGGGDGGGRESDGGVGGGRGDDSDE